MRKWLLLISLMIAGVLVAGQTPWRNASALQAESSPTPSFTLEPPTPWGPQVPTLEPIPLSQDPPFLNWRPPPYPPPLQLRPEDHFWLGRPIASGEVNWADPSYRYGENYMNILHTHTGVDMPAPPGTPVLASADGVVSWAGFGLFEHYFDQEDTYGLAVSIRHEFGYEGQPVYTAYAHLQKIFVKVGDHVRMGQEIGEVGKTGNATGPHLHFEVRIGADSYYATRNPELWLVPPQGWGVVAGRIESIDGWPLPKTPYTITSLDTGQVWPGWTYFADVTRPDDAYHENFAISDLPSGSYRITAWVWWRKYDDVFRIHPGETTFVLIQSGLPMMVNPTLTPAATPYVPPLH
jgi:murein DD-endopeptidase MepM/ murein hydrolase activator NlpD